MLEKQGTAPPPSNAAIGKFFGGIGFAAVTKFGTRLQDRMVEDRRIKSDLAADKQSLSLVKALFSKNRVGYRSLVEGKHRK